MVKIGSRLEFVESKITRVTHHNTFYFLIALGIVSTVFSLARPAATQMLSVVIFASTVLGTLLFWRLRLAFAIGGVGVLVALGVLSLNLLVDFISVDVLVFLVSMMIIVESAEKTGVFRGLTSYLAKRTGYEPKKLLLVFMMLGALMSALIDEVTAILVLGVMVLNLCRGLGLSPVPYLVSTVFAINIGSAATLFGNPIGVLIAFRAGLTFEDFVRWATPVAVLALGVATPILLLYYRKQLVIDRGTIKNNNGIQKLEEGNNGLSQLNPKLFVFVGVLVLIALHSRLEIALGLEKNTLLLAIPFMGAAIILGLEKDNAKHLVESGVDWWTLLFFIFLFAKAGTLQQTGVTRLAASGLVETTGGNYPLLLLVMIFSVMFLSGTIDNVPLIAAVIPVVFHLESLGMQVFPFWWALLFAGSFGGNLTLVGSTANIVALGLLEKRGEVSITFKDWLKVGFVVTLATTLLSYLLILLMNPAR